MNEISVKIKEWWNGLATREKQTVSIGLGLITLFIIYQWIWTPYLNHIADMRKQMVTQQKTLQWMKAADKEIQKVVSPSNGKNKTVTPIVMLSILQKQIKKAGFEEYLTQ